MRHVLARRRRTTLSSVFLGFCAIVVIAGCGAVSEREPAENLADLSERYWEWSLRTDPVRATWLGDHRYDGRLRDISPEAREARREQRQRFLNELREIEADDLTGQDLLTHRTLEEILQSRLRLTPCRLAEWSIDHRNGPISSFQALPEAQPLESPEDGETMARRWSEMGSYLEMHIRNLRSGLDDGLTAPRRPVELVIDQLQDALAKPDTAWPLMRPLRSLPEEWSDETRTDVRNRVRRAVAEDVRPAFRRYLAFLRQELLPRARVESEIGIRRLLPAERCYARLIRSYTSLPLSPEEILEYGRSEIDRIEEEMRRLGRRVLDTDDLAEIQRRLRTDPDLHFETGPEILRKAETATERVRQRLPDWFGRRPETPLIVRSIPEHEAPYTTIAYYRRPAADGSRPGTYFVNTHAPGTRPRYEAEALAFHEGIPGHHLQIALAQELTGIPEFRKQGGSTAFVEGWALYTERLADEMGLYSGDIDRLGMLSFDAWRASRLVVDTGIHAFGWSRQRAIDYMLDHTLLAENNIRNEVDRYIAWPGQAVSYKIGQREILRLRREMRERAGEGFRIRSFHDRVLENGALSLSILREAVLGPDGRTGDAGELSAP